MAELDLEEGAITFLGRELDHLGGRHDGDGVDGRDGVDRRAAGDLFGTLPRELGFQIPEGAIDGVAGRTGLHERQQILAGAAGQEMRADGIDGCEDGVVGLVIPHGRMRLAPAGLAAGAERDLDDLGIGFRAARDVADDDVGDGDGAGRDRFQFDAHQTAPQRRVGAQVMTEPS